MPSDSVKIVSLLFTIGRRLRDEGWKHRKRGPYSMLHFQTLRYVEEKGAPLIHDVAEYLCITPPAATLLIEGLVKDKLIDRSFDKKDRRAVRLTLTKRGKIFITKGIEKRMNKLKRLFAVLTAREQKAFIAILKKISQKTG